jgi:hypothetical protein
MSWITEVFIGIRCDRCHEIYEGSSDCSFFCDKESAAEYASEDGWLLENGRHYCPNCYTVNDDDEQSIKPEIPQCIFRLQTLLPNLTGTTHPVDFREDPDNFYLEMYMDSRKAPGFKSELQEYDLHAIRFTLQREFKVGYLNDTSKFIQPKAVIVIPKFPGEK